MGTRRTFIKKISALGVGTQIARNCGGISLDPNSDWQEIADLFYKSERLNFNTGSAGMMPIPVYQDFIENTKKLCASAPYEVLDKHSDQINDSMHRLSDLIDAPLPGLSLVRNSTEGINAILWSLPLEPGDEIIYSDRGYPYVQNTLNILKEVKGIKTKKIDLELSSLDSDITLQFQEAISSNTKLLIATHVTHKEGHILPVKELCSMAHDNGVEVLLDSAHAIGQIVHSVNDIACDYYVSSMHKWLAAPLGSAVLYTKEEHLEKLFPFYSYPKAKQGVIKKFDYTGTVAFQNKMTLGSVLDFNEAIGMERKVERLRELSLYLKQGLDSISGTELITDLDRAAGMVTFRHPSLTFSTAVKSFCEKYSMSIKKVNLNKIGALRISLNMHLMEEDIDQLFSAINDFTIKNK